jgi:two-component system, OmpR family, response regulator PrrA
MPQVLIVEDDAAIRSILCRSLTGRGYAVVSDGTGMGGLRSAVGSRPDLVLLDLGLPDIDGTDVLRMIRAVSRVPVIVVTARDDDAAVVDALDVGADDYMVKPFSGVQLEARIRAVLRRSGALAPPEPLRVGNLVVDVGAREARLSERLLDLRPREFDLLAYLAGRPGQVVTRRELLAEVWSQPYGGADKTVDVHVSWLRRKLGEAAEAPRDLHTVRGVGIKLMAP